MKRDLLSILDLSREEIDFLIKRAIELKHEGERNTNPLKGLILGLMFEKSSTRTLVSFQVAMAHLGGQCVVVDPQMTHIKRGEPLKDTSRILSRYADGIVIRTFSHETLREFSRYATIPVINGLTDLLHPCQILSDLMTIVEKKGDFKGLRLGYVGDGNNIANSWALAAAYLDIDLRMATPKGYEPDTSIVQKAREIGLKDGWLTVDYSEAVKDADILYTDVWTSMGKEAERLSRIKAFQGYQLNGELLSLCSDDVIVMHCLPAHRGEEITDEVIEGEKSVVFDQAENRLHMQKAILEMLLK